MKRATWSSLWREREGEGEGEGEGGRRRGEWGNRGGSIGTRGTGGAGEAGEVSGARGARVARGAREADRERANLREVVGAAWRCVQGQRLRTGKSRARESGGSADALLDAAAFEAARDAPSHELHDSTGSRSRKLVRGADSRRRVKVALRFGRTSACRTMSSGKDEREPTDRLVKSRPGRR